MVERERDQFKECWLQSKKKIIDLEVELNSIKKSDAATPDQKEKAV
jgi:hypothetical protein